jgi:membrane protein YdbS with pleckstrin-like domain
MSFELDKDEYVVYEARRNWAAIWGRSVALLFSVLIPLIVVSAIGSLDTVKIVVQNGNPDSFFMVLIFSWVFIVWNLLFVLWTDHYLDILVITNKHLIDIEQKGIFAREVSVIQLNKIQDITTDVHGFIPTVVGFGIIKIQSAGTGKEFMIHNINHPEYVRTKIKQAISGEIPEEQK